MMKNKGLYIHIPFCDEICPYCAFSHVLSSTNKQDLYINRLIEDIDKYQSESFSSIYIGGGTPSSLSISQLDKLLTSLDRFIHKDVSFTIEVNPNSINEEKIALFFNHGVNRISLGIETFNNDLQEKLKRIASYEKIKMIIDLIHETGINDINVDLMYGIEGEDIETLKKDLELMTSLNITHISCYCLQIEKNTIFYNLGLKEMNQDDAADQYDFICEYLKNKNFIHYEVSNFAKPDFQSKHNLLYWHNQEYVGIGISSAGFENNIRYERENSLTRYLKRIDTTHEEVLTNEDDELYYIILNLRLDSGINFNDFYKRYNVNFLHKYKNEVKRLNDFGFIEIDEEKIRVKEKYFFILNTILMEFM